MLDYILLCNTSLRPIPQIHQIVFSVQIFSCVLYTFLICLAPPILLDLTTLIKSRNVKFLIVRFILLSVTSSFLGLNTPHSTFNAFLFDFETF
jgi:hypothetical protein